MFCSTVYCNFNFGLCGTDEDIVLWGFESEKVGKNTDIELIKITQICVKMIEEQEEEVVRKMWEHLTKNYCSEVLIE